MTLYDSPSPGSALAILLVVSLSCLGPIGVARAAEPTKQTRIETEHLVLTWTTTPDSAEVEAVTAAAVRFHELVSSALGTHPDRVIPIVLGGSAERPGGEREYPRVDWMGRILLFTFSPGYESYLSPLAHEMVHAFRFDRRQAADWFFEEGFAEFVALRVDSSLAGFPWFDHPIPVVAGQWLERGEGIPLTTLRDRHREVSLPCGAQSYALRSAFFVWLGDTFGDDGIFAAAREVPAGGPGTYEKFFGKSLEALEADWQQALMGEYHSIAGVEATAAAYRRDSPIRYQRVCSEGVDF